MTPVSKGEEGRKRIVGVIASKGFTRKKNAYWEKLTIISNQQRI